MQLRLYLFWDIARRKFVVAYRRHFDPIFNGQVAQVVLDSRLETSGWGGGELPPYVALRAKRSKASKITCHGRGLVADFDATGNERLASVRSENVIV